MKTKYILITVIVLIIVSICVLLGIYRLDKTKISEIVLYLDSYSSYTYDVTKKFVINDRTDIETITNLINKSTSWKYKYRDGESFNNDPGGKIEILYTNGEEDVFEFFENRKGIVRRYQTNKNSQQSSPCLFYLVGYNESLYENLKETQDKIKRQERQ